MPGLTRNSFSAQPASLCSNQSHLFLQNSRKACWTDAQLQDLILLWWRVAGAASKWRQRPAGSEIEGVSDPGLRLLVHLDPHTLRPCTLVTILEGSFCPSASHLLHGHRTMGLQAITSRGLARGHRRVQGVRPHRLRGMGFVSSLLELFLPSYYTHPFSKWPPVV